MKKFFWFGVFTLCLISACAGSWLGKVATTRSFHDKAIELNLAKYHPVTGAWQWGSPSGISLDYNGLITEDQIKKEICRTSNHKDCKK